MKPSQALLFLSSSLGGPKTRKRNILRVFNVRFDTYLRYGASLGGTLCDTSKT